MAYIVYVPKWVMPNWGRVYVDLNISFFLEFNNYKISIIVTTSKKNYNEIEAYTVYLFKTLSKNEIYFK